MKRVLTINSHIRRVAHLANTVRRSAPIDATIFNLNVTDIHVTDDVTMKSHVLANNKPAVKSNADYN
jgi:hypothetical protein